MSQENVGSIMPRGLSLRNFRNAAPLIEYEQGMLATPSAGYKTHYSQSRSSTDYDVYAGEVLYETTTLTMPRSRTQQPYARSCLNSLLIKETNTTETQNAATLRAGLRVLGVAIKTCSWDAEVPLQTDDPVGATNGTVTMRHTGETHNIIPGDLILARLPKINRRDQLPSDNFTPMSPGRLVLETVPLRSFVSKKQEADRDMVFFTDPEKLLFFKSKCFTEFLTTLIPILANIGSIVATYKNNMARPAYMAKALDAYNANKRATATNNVWVDVDMNSAPIDEKAKWSTDFTANYKIEEHLKEILDRISPTFNYDAKSDDVFAQGVIIQPLPNDTIKVVQHFLSSANPHTPDTASASVAATMVVRSMMPVSAVLISSVASQIIGVAQSAGMPGGTFDMEVSPTIGTLLTKTLLSL